MSDLLNWEQGDAELIDFKPCSQGLLEQMGNQNTWVTRTISRYIDYYEALFHHGCSE